jgi:hypothetical protein
VVCTSPRPALAGSFLFARICAAFSAATCFIFFHLFMDDGRIAVAIRLKETSFAFHVLIVKRWLSAVWLASCLL